MRCPNCGLENPPSAMLCDCGHTFVPFTDGPTAVPDPECSAGGRVKHEKHGDGKSLVIAGYICGFAALVFLPPAFGLAAFVLGILNLTKGRVGHGVAHIVIAVTCGIAGMYIGAYIWQRNVFHLSSGGAVSSSQPAVAYEVRGTAGRVSLTYTNASGGMEQQTVTLPWNKDFGVPRGTMLYLSAQNENERDRECENLCEWRRIAGSGVVDPIRYRLSQWNRESR
jgi:hypothetical protein